MHYYSHHIGDYDRDTSALSLAQHGAYGKLMRSYYATERPLPADDVSLWRICGAMDARERAAVSSVAKQFFQEDGGVLRHRRIDAEIDSYREQLATASRAGKASAASRQRNRNARSTTVEIPLQRNGNDQPNATATNQEPVTRSINPSAHAPPSEAEVLDYAECGSTVTIPKDCALRWLTDRETSDWQRPKGLHMLHVLPNWQADLRGYAMDWKRRDDEQKHRQNQPKNTQPKTPHATPAAF